MGAVMNGYSEQILRYANNSDYVGHLAAADGIGEIGLGEGERGSHIAARFFIKVDRQKIESVRFKAFGCGYTIAACVAAAELAEASTINEILQIEREVVAERLGGLPADRLYCADLAVAALRAAVVSIGRQGEPVASRLALHRQHGGPRVSSAHPRYRRLMDSSCPPDIFMADRHLLACLQVVMEQEECPPEIVVGLTSQEFISLWRNYFPDIDIEESNGSSTVSIDPDLVNLLRGFIQNPQGPVNTLSGTLLAHILAARAARSGHLWVAMGLFDRAELGAAIKRHLPALFAANHQGMRWKRFFYKQICEQRGGTLCKSPVCGDCSEYELCFS
jgi:nitrogen fixation protein NifQ